MSGRVNIPVICCFLLLALTAGFVWWLSAKDSSPSSTPPETAQTAKDGGVIDLPPGEKLLSGGFAFGSTSLLTRPMRPGEAPETHTLFVVSYEGNVTKVTIREHAHDEKK